MIVALRAGLAGLLALQAWLLLVVPANGQEPITVDIDAPAVQAAETDTALVFVSGETGLDAFELEIRFDPTTVRIDKVEAAGGWQLIPQSVRVDRNGIIALAGFATTEECTAGPRCELARLAYVGRADGSAGFGLSGVHLFRSGVEIEAMALKPAGNVDPVESLPGDRPEPSTDSQSSGDGESVAAIAIWLFGLAIVLVGASAGIVAGSRWLWTRGTAARHHHAAGPLADPGWDGEIEGFLDRVTSLGSISFEEAPAPGDPNEH